MQDRSALNLTAGPGVADYGLFVGQQLVGGGGGRRSGPDKSPATCRQGSVARITLIITRPKQLLLEATSLSRVG